MRTPTRLIALACIAGLVLAACEDSDDKALSKSEYVTQANAICAKAIKASHDVGEDVPDSWNVEHLKRAYVDELLPLFRDEVKALRQLTPPEADRDKIDKMLDDLGTGIEQAKVTIEGVKTMAELLDPPEPSGLKNGWAAAVAYGIPTCGPDD
jgi:hypothetical protein